MIKTNFPVRGRKHLWKITLVEYIEDIDQNQLPRKGTETLSNHGVYAAARTIQIKTNFPIRGRNI